MADATVTNRLPEGDQTITPNPVTGEVELPGHANDPRGLPNLPFSVDSNRISDGVSSISPWTSTGPSFPLYKGGTFTDPTSRQDHEGVTSVSRVQQGTCQTGSGAYEKAQARLASLVASSGGLAALGGSIPLDVATGEWSGSQPDAGAKPTKSFTVAAGERWNPSGFAIQPGETYTVSVSGSWQDLDGQLTTNTMGYDATWNVRKKCYEAGHQCRTHLKQKLRFQRSNWMHLICGIGDYVTLMMEVEEDGGSGGKKRYLPIKEEEIINTLFAVDNTITFEATPDQEGELICFANDAEGLYYDNLGSVTVTVTRTSWPPSNEFDKNYVEYLKESLENPSMYDDYVKLHP